ncbi:hypothetical protein BV25DRAFT_1886938 [Artomyces pyxidatus]|uniref:Uncharacterized protein n=1 Tax=Artomyces pyxidatus TaxID=48021 RepID=A0ACB8SY60_9AGAM|nr:hypothetical protein BV25DRAFT_1886938 [Artomyces pyxidatus]
MSIAQQPLPTPSPPSDQDISTVSPSKAPSTSNASRSGWFSSLSRASGKKQGDTALPHAESERQRNDPEPRSTAPEELPTVPVTNIVPPTPPRPEPTQGAAEPSSSIPISIPVKRTWFSPASSVKQAQTPPTAQSPPPTGVASPLTPSSIDEEVPALSTAEPPSVTSSVAATEGNPNLSSLNPSQSRFALTIPFLGRPKVPLEQALASAKASDIREPVSEAPETPNDSAAVAPSGEDQPSESGESTLKPAPGDLPTSSQSSWWGYVGWTSGEPSASTSAAPKSPESVPSTLPAAPPSPPPPAETQDLPETPAQARATVQSVNSEGSTWYSPWAWYGNYSSGTEHSQDPPRKTEAELVKEEALAREDPKTEPPPPPPPAPEPANPIENSIAANASGWASFFSSRSLISKRITAGDDVQRDEHGAEIMDVDDDDDAGKSPSEPLTPTPPRSPTPSNTKTEPAPGKKKPENLRVSKRKSISPSPSKGSGRASPTAPRSAQPNLVLPTWDDTFRAGPRGTVPPPPASTLKKTMKFVNHVLFAKDESSGSVGKGKARARRDEGFAHFGKALPRAWDVVGGHLDGDVLRGSKRVVVIGIHGWFPGAVMRTVLGEPTGTSSKFVNMMCQALDVFQEQHGVRFDKITQIPLEGEGTINSRVNKLYDNLKSKQEWMDDLHAADAILVATHSQGSIVSTHLLDRLIRDKHIRTSRPSDVLVSAAAAVASAPGASAVSAPSPQRVCCLALCGIHLGPLRYLSSSSLLQPYIQYFESAAAKELFEFQNTESEVSKTYVKALQNVMDHGTKMVYIASLNDQVVPLYSGLFTAASHPLILRALYIDGDAYHSSDFLSNLLVLLLRIVNTGLSDSGLLAHLSEATAGSLNGVGHSTAYEELATYSLAVNYLFLTDHGLEAHPELSVEPFNANTEQNDYEIPWALRDLIADERVAHFFAGDFAALRNAFPNWHPKTTILRDIKRKLQPIQRLNSLAPHPGSSKL